MLPRFTPGLPVSYKASGCKPGLVWREPVFGDTVCDTQSDHDEVLAQNANADNNREKKGGAYGNNTCRVGYVWREANLRDLASVTPFEHDTAKQQNAAAASNTL